MKCRNGGDFMEAVWFYGSIVAIAILYINIEITLKKIKDNQDTQVNTVIGVCCSIFIFISIVLIFGR